MEEKNNALEKVENIIKEKNNTNSQNSNEDCANNDCSKDESIIQQDRKQQIKLKREQQAKRRQQLRWKREKEKVAKDRQRERKRERGVGGYITAIIALGIATLVLSSVLTFTYLMPSESDNIVENNYQRAFYDTVEQVNNMDINLSKVLATKDKEAMQMYLLDLSINSELAENNFSILPLKDENKFYTGKLINQIGDYAKFLSKKLIRGEEITSLEKQALQSLYQSNGILKDYLSRSRENIDENFSFNSMKEGEDNVVLDNFNELENLSVKYPELIYDGPFSDAKEVDNIKGLTGVDISQEEAQDIFLKLFAEHGVKKVETQGKTMGKIECYNVCGYIDKQMLYAQISVVGGKLIMFEYVGRCNETNYKEEEALNKAQEFMKTVGLEDMQVVWKNISDNEYTFNFVYTKNGVEIYPDMVKIRVCAETNMIIGFEGVSYYSNHCDRNISQPKLTETQAKEKVIDELDINSSRLALVKIGQKTETLCYEFCGQLDGDIYYVYIDALTGRQVQMFRVISTMEGDLLI